MFQVWEKVTIKSSLVGELSSYGSSPQPLDVPNDSANEGYATSVRLVETVEILEPAALTKHELFSVPTPEFVSNKSEEQASQHGLNADPQKLQQEPKPDQPNPSDSEIPRKAFRDQEQARP